MSFFDETVEIAPSVFVRASAVEAAWPDKRGGTKLILRCGKDLWIADQTLDQVLAVLDAADRKARERYKCANTPYTD